MPPYITILCPMRIEFLAVRAALRHAARTHPALNSHTQLLQTGIGRDAIIRTLDSAFSNLRATSSPTPHSPFPTPSPHHLFILAGACGGLAPTVDLPTISHIIDQHGHSWPCGQHWTTINPALLTTHHSPLPTPPAVSLIAVDDIIATPAQKQQLHRDTGASIVDMESHAFIAHCEHLAATRTHNPNPPSISWSVVRAVSDTPDETLPEQVLHWIDPAGNTRTLRAITDLARAPSLIPHMISVLRRSNRVLPQCGQRVAEICEHWLSTQHPRATATP